MYNEWVAGFRLLSYGRVHVNRMNVCMSLMLGLSPAGWGVEEGNGS
jgi:hypothetical protein